MSTASRPRSALRSMHWCGLVLALLAGCAATTPFQRPVAGLPGVYAHAPATDATAVATRDGAWWRAFGDPGLDALLAEVLRENNDLAAAGQVLRAARLQAGLARADLWPRPSGSLDARLQRDEEETRRSAGASLGVSWEADLWNRLGAARDAAQWRADATAADLEATALALVATSIDAWAELALLNRRIALGGQSLDHARRTLALVESQYRAGAVSGLELAEARQNVEGQAAAQRQFEQQRVELRASLALLLGSAHWDAAREPPSLDHFTLPPVQAGVPATLVERRPDLRAAELRLRAALAEVDAARASFYPRLTLTGSLGTGGDGFSGWLENPVLGLAAGLALPFLDWRRLDLSLQVSEAEFDRLVLGFRQALLQAYHEVDTALAAARNLEARGLHLASALAAGREAERIAEVRYRNGATALRAWLDAQERRRNAELALAQNQRERVGNRVLLFQALGAPLPSWPAG